MSYQCFNVTVPSTISAWSINGHVLVVDKLREDLVYVIVVEVLRTPKNDTEVLVESVSGPERPAPALFVDEVPRLHSRSSSTIVSTMEAESKYDLTSKKGLDQSCLHGLQGWEASLGISEAHCLTKQVVTIWPGWKVLSGERGGAILGLLVVQGRNGQDRQSYGSFGMADSHGDRSRVYIILKHASQPVGNSGPMKHPIGCHTYVEIQSEEVVSPRKRWQLQW
ncbi:hypothetical protein B9Z65_6284 [Elsinoe australis]|uniref:Uncharacterized protein n=1 Tax=Elsinoe australis TaxID=40998 RepID=A0A2P8A878_9PEZI|nr:hypothetical protein B9Z65_6284 [Elsinoe australis]